MSEDATTTTTSEDFEDNNERKYFSSRQGVRKTIGNPGKGLYSSSVTGSGNIDDSASLGPVQNKVASSSSRRKEHGNHHHHHHHHHQHHR